ncbi:MAG: hypothetical protein QOK03_3183 [Candidatus Binataceae bacterium]|nr:hypothetical protein [Candidatus Binataceae bacterium]
MASRIALDRYVYEDIYPAFKAATDEKELTANLSRTFLNYLAHRNLVLTGDSPAPVADIGCGPCDTLIKYLTGVEFPPGFIVRATDYLPEYADAQRGEALRVLAAAQARKIIPLVDFSVRAGNAFADHLLDLLSGPQDGAKMRRVFRIVYASHVMYHAERSSDAQRLIADVADNLLAQDGICIMYHVAITPGTFQEFRARFGSEAGAAHDSDTGAVTIDDPPVQMGAACAELRLPLYEKEFITRLRFGLLRDDDWQAFKQPRTYDALAVSNPSAYEDLKRLHFIVQRAPVEFAADHSATGLEVFIDEVRGVIEGNHGVLPLAERMQVLSRADAPAILTETIPDALAASTTSAAA